MAKNSAQPAPAPESGGHSSSSKLNLDAGAVGAGKPIRLKLNRRQQQALALAVEICKNAQKAAYAPTLANHSISATFVTQLLNDATATRTDTDTAVSATGGGMAATAGQKAKKKTLMRRLRRIQSAAKQKHQYLDPQRLLDYLVGQPIGQNRALLLQASNTIINKAFEERPSGLDTAFLDAAVAERTQYENAHEVQQTAKAQAQAARAAVKSFVESVSHRRREIQLAVDTAWPPGVDANVEVRKLFRIPLHKAM